MILGVSGKIGSGKSTSVRYLVQYHNFQHLSYSELLGDLFRAKNGRNSEPTRRDLQELGILLTNIVGHPGLTAMLLRGMRGERVVIDGIRHYDSYKFLVQNYGPQFRLLYRDLPINLRYQLNNERLGVPNAVSLADFQRMDNHLSEAGIDTLKIHADFVLLYFEDITQLYQALDTIVSG
jgi:hypothetical protein